MCVRIGHGRKCCFLITIDNGVLLRAQTLAFVAMIIVADDVCIWFFSLVGLDLSLSVILGWLFWPFAYLMGVEEDDLEKVSQLLGLKVLANEFLAYLLLGRYIKDGVISVSDVFTMLYKWPKTIC